MHRFVLLLLLAVSVAVNGRSFKMNPCQKAGFFPVVDNTPKFYGCYANKDGGLTAKFLNCHHGQVFKATVGYCVPQLSVELGDDIEDPTEPTLATGETEKPTIPTQSTKPAEPTDDTERPTVPTKAPTTPEHIDDDTTTEEGSTDGPTTEEPIITTEEPIITTEEPVETTEEPIITTEEPIITTEEPVITTEGPVITTEEPIVTTEEPVVSTDEPVTTDAPAVTDEPNTTDAPATTDNSDTTVDDVTNIPTTSEEPNTTDAPTTSEKPTGAPETTDAPNTTEDDNETTEGSAAPTDAPNTTEDDHDTTEDSNVTTDAPGTTEDGNETTEEPGTTDEPITPTPKPFNCPTTGFFPETGSCDKYVLCTENDDKIVDVHLVCPEGQHFNPIHGFCDAEFNCKITNTEPKAINTHQIECLVEGSFADRKDCTKYYTCTWNTKGKGFEYHHKQCAAGKVFNLLTGDCDKEGVLTCLGRTIGSKFGIRS